MLARIGIVLVAMGWLSFQEAAAQGPPATVIFRNDAKSPVIIQGISNIEGMVRRSQPILVAVGGSAGDFNVPAGMRFYSVYDANQPSRVLARDVPFSIPAGVNLLIAVRPLSPTQVGLVPQAARP